jgi:ribonuclease J
MSDSTNAERPGYTESEMIVGGAFRKAFQDAKGRIILATFASNISRIQQAVNTAVQFKRKVAVLGRSMVNNVQIATELGYLDIPEGVLIEADELSRYPDDQVLIVTTGSQGEPMAGLSRMASNNHRNVSIMPGDTVVISASPIPGNETSVGRTIDNLMKLGANVIHGKDKKIHVSGHASQEELKIMLNLVRPKFFIPVHGEFRMMKTHGDIAVSMGVKKENVLIGDNGQIFEFTNRSGHKAGRVNAGRVFVDGLGVGDVGNIVIRDRQQLAKEGMVIVVMTLAKGTSHALAGPDIVSRGFVYVRDSEALMNEAHDRVVAVLEKCEAGKIREWAVIKSQVRDTLSRYLFEKTRRRPMILPIIMEV